MANTKSLWLRLYTEILNDPKVQRLPDSLFRAYINFLCIAKEYSNDGVLPPKKDIAFFLRCPENSVKKFCDGLEKAELLDADGDTLIVHGWNNRQYESDNDPTANMRKRRQRERNKTQDVTDDVTDMSRVTSRPCHENVTRTETETETEIEIENIRVPQDYTLNRFIPPSLIEVKTYCKERNNHVDAERFVDFYQSKGWMVGKNKMKDWRSSVRTWEKDRGGNQGALRVNNRTAMLEMAEE